MNIGYARVSTLDQNPELQLDALKEAKCDKTYVDHASGAKADRPQWQELLRYIREGDTLVVWKLDRAFRTMKQAVEVLNDFSKRGVHLRVLTMDIDTHSPLAWVSEGWAYAKQILMFSQGVSEIGAERCVPTLRRSRGGSPRRV